MDISIYRNIKKGTLYHSFMEKCVRCGASEEKKPLLNAISRDGLVKICKECNYAENLLIVKKTEPKPTPEELAAQQKQAQNAPAPRKIPTVSLLDSQKKIEALRKERAERLEKESAYLTELRKKNVKEEIKNNPVETSNMLENFHWTVMRERRARHMSIKQLAEAISEPEPMLKLLEEGALPRERERIVQKLENYFRIKLTKQPELFQTEPKLNLNGTGSTSTAESGVQQVEITEKISKFDGIKNKFAKLFKRKEKPVEEISNAEDESVSL